VCVCVGGWVLRVALQAVAGAAWQAGPVCCALIRLPQQQQQQQQQQCCSIDMQIVTCWLHEAGSRAVRRCVRDSPWLLLLLLLLLLGV